MKTMDIYLSGGMGKFGKDNFEEGNRWRRYCENTLNNFNSSSDSKYLANVVNPNFYFNFLDEPPRYKSEMEVMKFDIWKLVNSNLVICNFNDPSSLGTMSEIAIAYDRRIPVIGLNERRSELHSWQICMCERIFDDIDDMLDYVEDFYLS